MLEKIKACLKSKRKNCINSALKAQQEAAERVLQALNGKQFQLVESKKKQAH